MLHQNIIFTRAAPQPKQVVVQPVFYQAIYAAGVIICCWVLLSACSVTRQIDRQANKILFKDSVIRTGHIGISIYEPATNKYWYNHKATNFFVPASNAKLFTLYAAMKYLGDSLVGLRYQQKDSGIIIYPSADPTFLHPDFKVQRAYDFLQQQKNIAYCGAGFTDGLGKGWAWDDYQEYFMAQRSAFPIYGNLITVSINHDTVSTIPKNIALHIVPREDVIDDKKNYAVFRKWENNEVSLVLVDSIAAKSKYQIPLVPNDRDLAQFLSDTLHQKITFIKVEDKDLNDKNIHQLFSIPTDSLLRPMMFNSDNFFAEQSLLMVSNAHLGNLNVQTIIQSLLKNDFADMPQKPRWVDGSGLSRYNLFSPQSLVYVINKMKNEFGLKRLQAILPTGGQGTLKNYFLNNRGFIFAKTGSMSNHTAISGLLYAKSGRLLIFSILANQFQGSTPQVRHAVEQFLTGILNNY